MHTLRMILGDQLTDGIAALDGIDPAQDRVLMAEVRDECTYVRHHKKKIVLVLSAMRHFADRLRARGVTVEYVAFGRCTQHALAARRDAARGAAPEAEADRRHRGRRVAADAGHDGLAGGGRSAGRNRPPTLGSLCSHGQFRHWAEGRRELRMEFFYREMRRRHGVLMDGDAPVEGRWNFDAENRKRMPRDMQPPLPPQFEPDAITASVIELVEREFGDHFGVSTHFDLPVTHEQAMLALDHFVSERLHSFGDWQDFMRTGDPVLFHALISTSLNCGLLDPLTACRAAERAWREGSAPLNAVEGFIRQILGWREYVRGIYWLRMPEYGEGNALDARRPLPQFYWSAETKMNCMAQAIGDTRENAYAHHIQRLMITGNFALLAGLDPDQVDEWYMIVYADAYQWVEMPNVRGMALFADGGVMGSKPYAASGAYINRMSDYCGACSYDVKRATGEGACPFNFLYWDFIARHRQRLEANPRMAMPARTLSKMDAGKVDAMRKQAAGFLSSLNPDAPGTVAMPSS